ncbi:hypothetical protein TNCV_3625281 [Trichonephila clavipes]|nr:hypothetical protein TNCV_3625281 [Trichonephila clavipes]
MDSHQNRCIICIVHCYENTIVPIYSTLGVGEGIKGLTTNNSRVDSTAASSQGLREESIVPFEEGKNPSGNFVLSWESKMERRVANCRLTR